ncbi:MAG TPA: DUF58 domain-containing protein [Spirochaetota bacterium]|nr:DUF58 domain-containing protein [Spirochaetota bacterium]HOL56390.1 DUF58 domain-containing protein [Spirochaetota bacterium]HPP04630.1 DUF58 domain-containing protein [Spirochaetota bacterium]
MKISFYPTRVFALLFIIPLVFAILNFYSKIFIYITIISDILILLIGFIDILVSPSYKKVDIFVEDVYYFNINSYNLLKVIFTNKNNSNVRFFIKFDLDISFDRDYSNDIFLIEKDQTKEKFIKIFSKRRGEFQVNYIFLKGFSLFRFFNIYIRENRNFKIIVLPYVSKVNQSFRLLQRRIYIEEGLNLNREIGDGNDFEMLKEYTKDDPYNRIEWKATARLRKPVTKIYRMNNSLDIILLIDCGRIMSTEVKNLSLLDYAINSSLLLSYASVKNNDTLSIICFSNDIKRYIPHIKDRKDFNSLRNILATINYDFFEPDYKQAFIFLSNNIRKRSLIIFFTDIIDDSNINIFKESFSLLLKRHFVLLILLQDKNLFEIGESIPFKEDDIYKKSAAADMILKRERTIEMLKKLGIDILDIFPEELNVELLNKYINIKNKS